MHESPVARELVQAAIAASANGQRVISMQILLGPDGGYLPDALEAHIKAAATGTLAQDAEVRVTSVLTGGPVLESIDVEEAD